MTLPIYSADQIKIYLSYDVNNVNTKEVICSKQLFGMEYITIFATSPNSSANEISFKCDNQNQKTIQFLNKDNIKIIFRGTNFYLSHYRVSVDIKNSNYYTKTGLEKCQSKDDCLPGFMCNGNTCTKCYPSCSKCDNIGKNNCIECNALTETDDGAPGGECTIDYLDISQHQDITINGIPPPMNNRVSLGFWAFVTDFTQMGNNIVHIQVPNFFVITLISNGKSPDIFISVFEQYNPMLTAQKQKSGFETMNTNQERRLKVIPNPKNEGLETLSGRWFFVEGGMSVDHKKFSIRVVMNGITYESKDSLPLEKLYSIQNVDVYNDVYFRTIFRTNDETSINIINNQALNTKVFLRNMILFQEMLPTSINYMYYSMEKLISNPKEFPEILAIIPFNKLSINEKSTEFLAYTFKSTETNVIQKPIEIKQVNNPDFYPPLNFKSLSLYQERNVLYTTTDFTTTTKITCSNAQLCYDQEKPLTCNSNYWMNTDLTCKSTCDQNRIAYPGVSTDKGICDYKCGTGTMKCNTNNVKDNFDIQPDNFCISDTVYNLYYSCSDYSKEYVFYYNRFHNPEDIVFDFTGKNFFSYFIEFWYYPDFTIDFRELKQITESYVFYTNSFQVTCNEKEIFKLICPMGSKQIDVQPYEWNKIILIVKYENDDKKFYLKGAINNQLKEAQLIKFNPVNDNNLKLQYIKFSKYFANENKYWYSGFYKHLRIWDGDKAEMHTTFQYDLYFSNYKNRVDAIIAYYPLTGRYFANNVIKDPEGDDVIVKNNNIWYLQLWNYSSKFDYYIVGKTLQNKNNNVQHVGCPNFCVRCFTPTICYKCDSDHALTSSNTCAITPKRYYFRNPGYTNLQTTADDVLLNFTNPSPERITVTFWMKVLALSTAPSYLVQLGNDLQLYYENDRTKTDSYGLTLRNLNGNKIIAQVKSFRNYFGMWKFYSIAFFNSLASPVRTSYFPSMMKFEIEKESFPLNYDAITGYSFNINSFTISKTVYGLFYNVLIYTDFVIGALGFELNTAYPNSPFTRPSLLQTFFPVGSTPSECFSSSYITNPAQYTCVLDHDERFEGRISTANHYLQYNDDEAGISFACTGCRSTCFEKGKCTCMMDNTNSQMIMKNGNNHYCIQYPYINWAMAREVKIENVSTAKMTNKYTMHFWFFAYSYTGLNFEGLEFKWNYHNIIRVKKVDDKYIFSCVPTYKEGDTEITDVLNTEITINQWNFVSCAVDYTSGYYYITTNNKSPVSLSTNTPSGSTVPTYLKTYTTTTLTITELTLNSTDINKEDWGVLFYKQIRLWTEVYFSAEYLSRILITHKLLFPYLIHQWEPSYNINNKVSDNVGNAKEVTVIYNGLLGPNVVDEADFVELDFCSDEGGYYDTTTEKCLQFTDLSQMNDINFPNLAVSYTGNYAMAFWILVEDANSMTNGIHLTWSNHLQITVKKNSLLDAICFPQGYYSDSFPNTNIDEKYSNPLIRNKYKNTLDGFSGVWNYVICSVSNYNRIYAINGLEKDLLNEPLYNTQVTNYPLRYYFSSGSITSTLTVSNLVNPKKIYLRVIELFNDYIPYEYTIHMRYSDLTDIVEGAFPSLLFVCNFATFDLTKKTVSYDYYKYENNILKKKKDKILLTSSTAIQSTLSANFVFLPLCHVIKNNLMRYNKQLNKCVPISDCIALNTTICMDNGIPLTCNDNNYFIRYNSLGETFCMPSCDEGFMRAPGSKETRGICNMKCDRIPNISTCPSSALSSIKEAFKCSGSSQYKMNYRCYTEDEVKSSALFISRCYQQPNMYVAISQSIRNKLKKGYIYEQWFKRDTVLKFCKAIAENEYYIFSKPHRLYQNPNDSKFYYSNGKEEKPIEGISLYEWNIIIIEVIIYDSGNSDVKVYVNFNFMSPISLFSTATAPMDLESIGFCSSKGNGKCSNSDSDVIYWGSAYYKNIRVWDITTASINIVQAYNNKQFGDDLKSLILYYPLTIDKMDNNVIQEVINGQNIKSSYEINIKYSSLDEYSLYNYAVDFDWVESNPNNFIVSMDDNYEILSSACSQDACRRCYSSSITDCYECQSKYVLVNKTCTPAGNYYLKAPSTSPDSPLPFIIIDANDSDKDLTKINSFTLTIWMKFLGVINGGTLSEPSILIFNDNTYIAYDISTTNLIVRQGNGEAFRDTSFNQYFGKWILLTVSIHRSEENDVYPHMFTFSVNKVDIPFSSGYSIPPDGFQITSLNIGSEIVALFADLRIYNKFIQGSFGTVMATQTEGSKNLVFHYKLTSNAITGCADGALPASTGYTCVSDYMPYLDSVNCNNDQQYFDIAITEKNPPCASCSESCITMCFDSGTQTCTCDLTQGYYWLRKHQRTSKTYCEFIPYVDFSMLKDITINPVPASKTKESTIEFWLYVYSYNSDLNNFKQIIIEWDLHNKITIDNKLNTLSVTCYPLYKIGTNIYSESSTQNINFFKWNFIRCGTDLASEIKEYFLNNVPYTMTSVLKEERGDTSVLKIYSPKTIANNFGFVFLKDIKLWQQYNLHYIDSSRINIISFDKFPGLLALYKTDHTDTKMQMTDVLSEETNQTILLYRRDEFIGYNIIDPKNLGYYSDLKTCDEGYVFNAATSTCVLPSLTHCEYPGDISDNCVTCKANEIYIDTDGSCVSSCPDFYYENKMINQCRKCHSTCLKCTGLEETQCTKCTDSKEGDRYFIQKNEITGEGICVLNCEEYGLTKSSTPNICTLFDADAKMIEPLETDFVDINSFAYIVAEVFNATSEPSKTEWQFNEDETLLANANNETFSIKCNPLNGDVTQLNTSIDKTCVELDSKYVFDLFIIKENLGEKVIVKKTFTLTMNGVPKNGELSVIPDIGLYNTTTFVITCDGWTDDTTQTENLEFEFTYFEKNTLNNKYLSNWSKVNEVYSNFTVVYYQKPINIITITCRVRDHLGAISTRVKEITIVNSITNPLFSIEAAVSQYTLPDNPTSAMLLHRSEFLKSLGVDLYKNLQPELLQTKFEPALDQSVITMKDPECTSDYCNSNGDCVLVEEFIVCNCEFGYVGRNCHIDKNGYGALQEKYSEMFTKIFGMLQNSINYEQFKSLYNLFFAAHIFYEDKEFFSVNLDTYLTLAMNLFSDSIKNNTIEYIDLFDLYYSFSLTQLNKQRASLKNQTGYPDRNVTLTEDAVKEFSTRFLYLTKRLLGFLKYLVGIYKTERHTIEYTSKNFFIGVTQVNPTFDDNAFFESRKEQYKSHLKFMECLNHVEIEKLGNPYYQAWMIYIEYFNLPFGYNKTLSVNNTSPLIDIQFIDVTTGKEIQVNDCTGDKAIKISMPFQSYNWYQELNRQKWLYDPNNYKSPDDPIFSDPIYINSSGKVENDTIDERIEKYNRLYNFSCRYYDTEKLDFIETNITYTNFTSDTNFIEFNTTHLTMFTTFFTENVVTFHVLNRFFYLKRPQIFKYFPNYTNNFAVFVLGGFLALYIILVISLSIYDNNKYFKQESLLEFLKREIVKVFLPYNKEKEKEIKKIIPTGFNPGIEPEIIFKQVEKAPLERDQTLNDDFKSIDEKDPNNILTINKENGSQEGGNVFEHLDSSHNLNLTPIDNRKKKFYEGNNTENSNKNNPYLNQLDVIDTQTRMDNQRQNTPQNDQNQQNEDDYEKRLEAYAALNLSTCQFINENLRKRHMLSGPLINVSLFNPRWKKMTLLLSEISFICIMISVQLTSNENATLDTIGTLVQISFLSVLASDTLLYILPIFFYVSYSERKKLYQLVISGKQLVILKEWENLVCRNCGWTIVGLIINVGIWIFSLYISIGFVAVWTVQKYEWLICFGIAFFMDFVIFEVLMEVFVGLFYIKRKKVSCMRVIGEFFNQVRNYRCLSP